MGTSMNRNGTNGGAGGRAGTLGVAMALMAGGLLAMSALPGAGVSSALGRPTPMVAAAGTPDRIVMRDGRVVEGTIVEETDGTVSIKVLIAGIQAGVATVFNKSDVLRIDRAPAGDPAPAPTTTTTGVTRPAQPTTTTADPNAVRVYHLRLGGEFAKDITQTPIRAAIEDAASQQAQIIIVEVDNEWKADQFTERSEDEHAFDEFWRTEEIAPIFTNDLNNLWTGPKPRVIMWVKNAMGGAAFLPFLSREIYFAPEGRMGGIGDLDTYFEGSNEWFKDKQQSLRLGAARGLALGGGYDSRLIDAMCMRDYVLSVGFESGRPEFYAGLPRPEHNEELLTDDGKDGNKDSDADVVRARGNDNLTLHADIAQKLNVSRGTVATLDDLLFELGVSRNHVMVSDRADRIMDDWATGIDNAIRSFMRMRDQEWPEAQAAESGGEWEQRNRARGRQKTVIESMVRLLLKYKEVLDPDGGLKARLELELEAIRLRSIADRRP